MIPKKISAVTALVIISVLFFTGCKDKANTSSASSGTVSSKPSVSSDETPINSDSPPASDTSSVSSKPHNDASSQPHLHAYKITVVQPTCTEDGYKLFKCSCGRWYTQKDKEKPVTNGRIGWSPLSRPQAPRAWKSVFVRFAAKRKAGCLKRKRLPLPKSWSRSF